MREPTREEVEAWAAFLLEHPEVLSQPEAPAIARLIAFRARADALRKRQALRIARETLRAVLSGDDALTADRVLAARRAHLDGDHRPEWDIALTSRSTYLRRRRQFGLIPWPRDYQIGTLALLP